MNVAFDNTFLSLALHPNASPASDPSTGKPVTHHVQRIEALIDSFGKSGSTILIPTPCLAELLCVVPHAEKIIEEMNRSSAFEIVPFDARCAVDFGAWVRSSKANGDKKSGTNAGWNEVKFDKQIAVIAKVHGAESLYTDDENQSTFAQEIGLKIVHTWELDLPPKYAQTDILDGNK